MSAVALERSENGIVTLRIDRPPVNALDLKSIVELIEAIDELAPAAPRAVLITGTGGFFSAGADLDDPPIGRDGVLRTNELVLKLFSLPFPVIAALTGHAVGSGLIVGLCCDHRIASSSGRYGLPEVLHGFSYPQAAFDVVRHTLTPQAAQLISLGSELLGAQTCLDLGVFEEVVEPESVLPRAIEETERRAAMPGNAYARAKAVLRADALAELRRSCSSDPLLDGS
ncbi:MAG: enoyl-CoA hydratase/isomerase family protein [Solirubrobacterales bacterium]